MNLSTRNLATHVARQPAILLVIASLLIAAPVRREELPEQIDNASFWQLIQDLSETGGEFRLENFMSNERTYQSVVPALERAIPRDGVYIGVGPEQNFTYLVAVRPKIAFILDVRRQNMVEHLLYKALFELSSDRTDFLARLFSRTIPPQTGPQPLAEIFNALTAAKPDPALRDRNFNALWNHLTISHRFRLSDADRSVMSKVFNAFFSCGPQMDFHCLNPGGGFGAGLTYSELLQQTDANGRNRSFLADEQSFLYVQTMQRRNSIIPVVGDFAGPKALRAIGAYLRSHNATVSVFYLSNVEDYLFPEIRLWRAFYENVATLPMNESSLFIRVAQQAQYATLMNLPQRSGEWVTLLSPMKEFMSNYQAGRVISISHAMRLTRLP